ncbi:hypothetical protein P691DRAFT_779147 [Macrolepiota fuliginosa MF-IS2]|uniref:Uncharacterized protein n=1 Tax=Macrolepiota fuliginosa MF-IS2 TaxID=1400762 RepID=A0A9P6BYW9_9AGAR|nr:hypothetical protein P691DRAFT_779147 [Macrolepiota fuliginosa MF-IS2]
MSIPPELQAALDVNLSTQEVIGILCKYHSVSWQVDKDEDKYKPYPSWSDIWKGKYSSAWQPLGKYLQYYPRDSYYFRFRRLAPSDPLENIRRTLRGRIIAWLCNAQREQNMFWILDPLAVLPDDTGLAASYAARTFIGISKQTNQFGAHLHLDYKHTWDNAICDLVAMLAKACPQYRRLVTRVLMLDDPMILEKPAHLQFKKLIVEPWEAIRVSHPHYLSKPLLIMIDIFGSFNPQRHYPEHRQHELIGPISDYSQSHQNSPLLWLFCSRHTPRLRQLLDKAVHPLQCALFTVLLNDAGAQRDTRYLLDEGFCKIRNKYNIGNIKMWPSEEQLSRMTKAISGVVFLAEVVLNFIDYGQGKPQDKADLCLKYLDGIPEPSVSGPFRTLDYFYDQFISDLSPHVRPDALRILEALGNGWWLDTRHLAHILRIDRSRFYHALDKFHAVLQIPPPRPQGATVKAQSPGSGSFLASLTRKYHTSPILLQSSSHFLDSYPTLSSALKVMKWTPSQPVDDFNCVGALRHFAQSMHWLLKFIFTDGPQGSAVYDQIRDFDFRHLVSGPRPDPLICHYSLQWLFSQRAHLPNIIRTDAMNASDRQFIEKCREVTIPLVS